jgi:hypothetical protein
VSRFARLAFDHSAFAQRGHIRFSPACIAITMLQRTQA